ncbi:MAG: hypothetical protein ACO1RA_09370 [Planctomycetaceae bacterium]
MRLPSPFDEPEKKPTEKGSIPPSRHELQHRPTGSLQYSLGGLFGLTFVASVAFAPAYYFMKARTDATMQMPAILLAIAAPLLVMVVVSVMFSIRDWFIRR